MSAPWLKGRGTAGIATDPNITPAQKLKADEEERKRAQQAVGNVVGSVAGNHEQRLIEYIVAKACTGARTFDVKQTAQEAAVSAQFISFFTQTRKSELVKHGFEITNATTSAFTLAAVVAPAATAAPVATAAATSAATTPTVVSPRARAARTSRAAAQAAAAPAPTAADDKDFFYFDAVLKTKIMVSIAKRRNHWLWGPTGAGKSEFFDRLLALAGVKSYKVNCHGESSADDILGHYTLRDGNTVWIEGALVKAMKEGCPLIIEENDIAPAEVNMVLQRVLEIRPGQSRKFHNARNGEDVEAKDGFCVLATGNSAGGGDHTGIYAGVQTQNAAYRDRYVFDRVDYLPGDIEIEVLVKRTGMGRALAEKAVELAKAARQALKEGRIFTPVSTRTLLAFGAMTQDYREAGLDPAVATTEAMKSALLFKAASPSDEIALKDMIQRIFGSGGNTP